MCPLVRRDVQLYFSGVSGRFNIKGDRQAMLLPENERRRSRQFLLLLSARLLCAGAMEGTLRFSHAVAVLADSESAVQNAE